MSDKLDKGNYPAGVTALQEQGEADSSARGKISGWLRLTISILLLTLLVMYIDLVESWQTIRDAQPIFILMLFTLFLAQRFLSAYRWFVLLHGKNVAITFGKIIRLTFISVFLGTFMPGGTELARLYLLSKTTSDLALTVSSLLVERMLALIALLCLAVFALLAEPPGLPSILGHLAWLALVLLTLGSLTLMNKNWRKMIDRLLSRQWLSSIREGTRKFYTRLDAYANQPWLLVWSMVLAFGMQLIRVGCTIFGAWALGVQLPMMTFLAIVPLIFLIALLPISVAGLGVRETAFVSLFSLAGVSAEVAFTLSILLFVMSILTTLPGAYFNASESTSRN